MTVLSTTEMKSSRTGGKQVDMLSALLGVLTPRLNLLGHFTFRRSPTMKKISLMAVFVAEMLLII